MILFSDTLVKLCTSETSCYCDIYTIPATYFIINYIIHPHGSGVHLENNFVYENLYYSVNKKIFNVKFFCTQV